MSCAPSGPVPPEARKIDSPHTHGRCRVNPPVALPRRQNRLRHRPHGRLGRCDPDPVLQRRERPVQLHRRDGFRGAEFLRKQAHAKLLDQPPKRLAALALPQFPRRANLPHLLRRSVRLPAPAAA